MASAGAASPSLTTLDFLRHLREGGRLRFRPNRSSRRRMRGRNSCGDADCGGIHFLGSACVRFDHVDRLHRTIDQKVQVVGVKLKTLTNQILDIERRLRLVNASHYYASAECLLLARLTALASLVHSLLRYVMVLRYDKLKLEAIKKTARFAVTAKDQNLLLGKLWQLEGRSERAQARLSASVAPIDELCLANNYVDDESYSIIRPLYSGIMEDDEITQANF